MHRWLGRMIVVQAVAHSLAAIVNTGQRSEYFRVS
jgi:hypothetical protein